MDQEKKNQEGAELGVYVQWGVGDRRVRVGHVEF